MGACLGAGGNESPKANEPRAQTCMVSVLSLGHIPQSFLTKMRHHAMWGMGGRGFQKTGNAISGSRRIKTRGVIKTL